MDRRQALKGIATLVGAAALPLPGVPAALTPAPDTLHLIWTGVNVRLCRGDMINIGNVLYECVGDGGWSPEGYAVDVKLADLDEDNQF